MLFWFKGKKKAPHIIVKGRIVIQILINLLLTKHKAALPMLE